MESSAKVIKEERLFSSKEFFQAAGNPSRKGKQLAKLGQMLDRYNSEVASPDSSLTPAEKTVRTLELRETALAFAERKSAEGKKFYKRSSQSNQRILGTNAVINQLDLLIPRHISQDKAGYSTEMHSCLCEDIRNHRGALTVRLFQQPKMLGKVLEHMLLPALLNIARATEYCQRLQQNRHSQKPGAGQSHGVGCTSGGQPVLQR